MLDAASTLDKLMQLRPVTYRWNGESGAHAAHIGLIAQEVAAVFPEFVTTDTAGRMAVAYSNFIPVMISAMQEINYKMAMMNTRLTNLEQMVASSTAATATSSGISLAQVGTWLADATNGLGTVFANAFHAKQEICVDDQCLNKDDVRSLLALAHAATTTSSGGDSGGGNATSTPGTDTSAPVITIVGNNPATVTIGTSYADLGATVTDTNADGSVNNNLGLHFSVDGSPVTDISLDTSTTTTHTIIYSAIDSSGNWGFATRTVNVISQ